MNFTSYVFFKIIIVVGQLNGFNVPPAAAAGQQQVHAISCNSIYTVAQRTVQLMQAYGTEKLMNGNGTNFWDQFLAMALLITSHNKVYIYIYVASNQTFTSNKTFISWMLINSDKRLAVGGS